jgi:hypothetical protein
MVWLQQHKPKQNCSVDSPLVSTASSRKNVERSTTADPMLIKVKPQHGRYLYFVSEGCTYKLFFLNDMYNLLFILYCSPMINKTQSYECIQISTFHYGAMEISRKIIRAKITRVTIVSIFDETWYRHP